METTTSADGTVIAYDHTGSGPVLIVCVGAFCTRHTFAPTADLASRFTVVTYDRRGRGDSGDTAPFTPAREYQDLAAVAAATGAGAPFVFGHSSGGAIALRAAAAGMPMAGIVAYEAPFLNEDAPRPDVDPAAHIRELVAAGREREAVIFWMRDVVGMPAQAVAGMQDAPWAKALDPLARTLPYDLGVAGHELPERELAAITAPVLIVGGANSPAWFKRSVAAQAAAIPRAELMTLDGYDHNAPPEVIGPVLAVFFTAQR
ncbi:MAG TPA: alpha/beta hydrolase [Trebonia sp.]|nr:alpha/beta hydrolase [Trebonia sp.]